MRVTADDEQRTVTIAVRRDGAWQPIVSLDAHPQSPTFGLAL